MACPNRNLQEYKDLKEAVGSDVLAHYLWNKNNGNPLSETPEGKPSELYKELLEKHNGDIVKALEEKAKFYTKQHLDSNPWIKSGIEPKAIKEVISDIYKAPNSINRDKLKVSEEDRLNESKTKKALGYKKVFTYDGSIEFKKKIKAFNDINGTAHMTGKVVNTPLGDFSVEFLFNPRPKVAPIGDNGLYPVNHAYDIYKAPKLVNTKLSKEDAYIANNEYQTNKLREDISSAKDISLKAMMQERITRLEKDLKKYKEDKRDDIIFSQAGREMKMASLLLEQAKVNTIDIQQGLYLAEHVKKMVALWSNTDFLNNLLDEYVSPLPNQTTVTQEKIKNLNGTANELNLRATKILKDLIVKFANQELNKEVTEESLFGATTDVWMGSANTMDIGRMGKDIGNMFSKVKRNVASDTRVAYDNWEKVINDKVGKLSKSDHNLLMQEKDGKLTGNLVQPIHQDYFDAREAQKPEDVKDKQGWVRYFKWINKHSIALDPRKLFLEDYNDNREPGKQRFTDKDRLAHIEELKKELGDKLYEKYYNEAQRKHNRFIQQREATNADVISKADGLGMSVEAYMDEWNTRWSPYSAVEYMQTGQGKIINGEKVKVQGHKNLEVVTRRFVDGQKTKWYDSKYENLLSKPELLEAHETIMDAMHELKEYLPEWVRKSMQVNSLPAIMKTFVQKVAGKNVSLLQGLGDKIQEMFYETGFDDRLSKNIDPNTGREDISPKIRFVKQNIPLEERSLDLPTIVKAFAYMAETYRHKSLMTPVADAVELLVNNMEELKLDPQGNVKPTAAGNDWAKSGELKNFKAAMISSIETFREMQKPALRSESKTMTREDKRKKKDLDEDYLSIISMHQSGKIGEEEMNKQLASITVKQENLGHYFSYTKMGNSLLVFNQLRGMGWNVGAGIARTIFGTITNLTHAASEQDYTVKEHKQAALLVHTPFSDSSKKISILMRKFDQLKDYKELAQKGHDVSKGGWKEKFYPMEIMRSAEYSIRAEVMTAMMLHKKVMDKNGKEIPLLDAYDKNGEWDTEKMGENNSWNGSHKDETHNRERRKWEIRMDAVQERLHGNYNPATTMMAKRTFLGKALLQYRSWLPESIAVRWEKEKFDDNLDRIVKGRWRSYKDYFNHQGGALQGSLGIIYELGRKLTGQRTTFDKQVSEDFTETDSANMKANLQEVSIYLSMYAATIALKAMFAGDDKHNKMAGSAMFWINEIDRMQGDISLYASPSGTVRIVNNILPSATLATDVIALTHAVHKYAMDDNENSSKDLLSVGKKVGKLVPGLAAGESLWGSASHLQER
jgi:hypothetical protein